MSETISQQALRTLIDTWIDGGRIVAGPRRLRPDRVAYATLHAGRELLLDGFIRPANSIKEFLFPRHEVLYRYRVEGRRIILSDPEPPAVEQVIVAARPCDAASLPIIDHVFNWDDQDAFYNRRRELTTVVTLACQRHDAHCFCTSVGLAPDAERGSDVLLLDLGDDSYEVRCLTDRGRALMAGRTQPDERTAEVPPGPGPRFDADSIAQLIAPHFDSPQWQAMTLRCLGCGACTYTCPTCHCFDIVDERTAAGGVRARNWDACQFGLFTRHASGHNPRTRQGQRQRQRIMHKFSIYPARFGEILCTGCGNCTRNCPVDLGVKTVIEQALRYWSAPPGPLMAADAPEVMGKGGNTNPVDEVSKGTPCPDHAIHGKEHRKQP